MELWPEYVDATAAFASIYSDVTGRLRALAARSSVSQNEKAWFDYLIHGFQLQYASWQWKSNIREYLRGFHRKRVPRLFALSGDVYLHIAYDLPRVIATSFSGLPADEFNVVPIRPNSADEASLLYLSATDEFFEVLERHATSYSVAGLLAFPAAIARGMTALRVMGFWVIALRNAAWIHAQVLARSTRREELEDALLAGVNAASESTLRSPWNPAKWCIPTPRLAAAVLVILGGCAASGTTIAPVLWMTAAVLVMYTAFLYSLTVRAVDELGRSIFNQVEAALRRAVAGEEGLYAKPLLQPPINPNSSA